MLLIWSRYLFSTRKSINASLKVSPASTPSKKGGCYHLAKVPQSQACMATGNGKAIDLAISSFSGANLMSWPTPPHSCGVHVDGSSHWSVSLLECTDKQSTLTLKPTHPKVRSTSQRLSTSDAASKIWALFLFQMAWNSCSPWFFSIYASPACLQKQLLKAADLKVI